MPPRLRPHCFARIPRLISARTWLICGKDWHAECIPSFFRTWHPFLIQALERGPLVLVHTSFRWRHVRQHTPRPSVVVLLICSLALVFALSACSITIGNVPTATPSGPGISEQVQVVQDQSG